MGAIRNCLRRQKCTLKRRAPWPWGASPLPKLGRPRTPWGTYSLLCLALRLSIRLTSLSLSALEAFTFSIHKITKKKKSAQKLPLWTSCKVQWPLRLRQKNSCAMFIHPPFCLPFTRKPPREPRGQKWKRLQKLTCLWNVHKTKNDNCTHHLIN